MDQKGRFLQHYVGKHSNVLPVNSRYGIHSGYIKDVTIDSAGITFWIMDEGNSKTIRIIFYSMDLLPPELVAGNTILEVLFT